MSDNSQSVEFVFGATAADPVAVEVDGVAAGVIELSPTSEWVFTPTAVTLTDLTLQVILDNLQAR